MTIRPAIQYESFVSIPEAFEGVDEGLKHVLKFQFRTIRSDESRSPLGLDEVFMTDRFLVDLASADPESLQAEQLVRDCDYVKKIVSQHTNKIGEILRALQSADVATANALATEIGLTEQASVRAGGGVIGLIVVALIALAAEGCGTCNSKRPASDPKAGPK